MKNYYEILEVNPRASEEVIKKAHQVLIKKYHPDLYVGVEREKAEEKIRNIILHKKLSLDTKNLVDIFYSHMIQI